MRISILVLLVITLSACGSFKEKFGRKQGETLVTIDLHREHDPLAVYPMYGGVWIILKSESGADFMKTVFIPNETAQVQISAPNGMYKAGVVGWEGNATPGCTPGTNCNPGEGQAKCDIAFNDTTFPLTGTAFTIPIVLSQTKCQNPPWGSAPFSDVAYNPIGDPNFPAIKFYFTAGTFNSALWYVRVILNLQTKNGSGIVKDGNVKLGCTSMAGGQLTTPLHLPVGKSGDNIFSYTVELHSSGDTTCVGAPVGILEFPAGFATAPTSPTHSITSFGITYAGAINTLSMVTSP